MTVHSMTANNRSVCYVSSTYKQALLLTKQGLVEIPDLLISPGGDVMHSDYLVPNRNGFRKVESKSITCRPRSSRVPYLEFSHKGVKYNLHRVLASTFKDIPEGCTEVRHLDDVITNNRLSNLEWGTRADNAADSVRNGRHATGKTNPRSYLIGQFQGDELIQTMCGKKDIKSKGLDQSCVHKAVRNASTYLGYTFRRLD